MNAILLKMGQLVNEMKNFMQSNFLPFSYINPELRYFTKNQRSLFSYTSSKSVNCCN